MPRSASKKTQTQTQTPDAGADVNQQEAADNYTPDSYRDERDDPNSEKYDPDRNGSATQERTDSDSTADPVDHWIAPERSPDFSTAPRQPNAYTPPAHDPGHRIYNEKHTHEMRDKKGNKTGSYVHKIQRWHPTLFG